MRTTVVMIEHAVRNWRSLGHYIYIGSPQIDADDVAFDGTPFSTPYSVPRNGEPLDCWTQYRNKLMLHDDGQEICDLATQKLHGRVLVCDCGSKVWCHGNILALVADGLWNFGQKVPA